VRRWLTATGVGSAGGAAAGVLGGLLLLASPASAASSQAPVALAVLGALAGAAGSAGIAFGIALAEATARSWRLLALPACAALAGAIAGGFAHLVVRSLLVGLFGLDDVPVGGVVDGLVLGAAAGVGYGAATRGTAGGDLAAPRGGRRVLVAFAVGTSCAAAGVALSLSGRALVGGLINEISRAAVDAQLGLAPLGRLIGQPDFSALTRSLLAAFEGGVLGLATAWGLTYRPRPRS